MWLLCEIPLSTVSRLNGKANSFIRKWLGLPRCLSETGIFRKNMLQLALQSVTMGYKQEKARLVMEMKESTDQSVRNGNVQIRTGHKWKAQVEVDLVHLVQQLQSGYPCWVNHTVGGRVGPHMGEEQAEICRSCGLVQGGRIENQHLLSRGGMLRLCRDVSCPPHEGSGSVWCKPLEGP